MFCTVVTRFFYFAFFRIHRQVIFLRSRPLVCGGVRRARGTRRQRERSVFGEDRCARECGRTIPRPVRSRIDSYRTDYAGRCVVHKGHPPQGLGRYSSIIEQRPVYDDDDAVHERCSPPALDPARSSYRYYHRVL